MCASRSDTWRSGRIMRRLPRGGVTARLAVSATAALLSSRTRLGRPTWIAKRSATYCDNDDTPVAATLSASCRARPSRALTMYAARSPLLGRATYRTISASDKDVSETVYEEREWQLRRFRNSAIDRSAGPPGAAANTTNHNDEARFLPQWPEPAGAQSIRHSDGSSTPNDAVRQPKLLDCIGLHAFWWISVIMHRISRKPL
jgi:hypothetical protein